MSRELWLPLIVLIVIADFVVVVAGMAMLIDRKLIEKRWQWRFGLMTLLVLVAILAMNIAAIASFFGRQN